MTNCKILTDSEGEVRELTARDAAEAVAFSALPEAERRVLLKLTGTGTPPARDPQTRNRENSPLQSRIIRNL